MRPSTRTAGLLGLLAAALLLAAPARAASFPDPTGYLVDAAHQIPDAEQRALEAELSSYAQRSGHQVAVAVVRTTGSASIENYAHDLFGHWGIGDAKRDDGVLLLVATDDHHLRIEVGRGLEGELTDVQAADIVRQTMVPRLQAGDLVGAVRDGERAVRAALSDPTPDAAGDPSSPGFAGYGGGAPRQQRSGGSLLSLLPLLLVGLVLFSVLSARRGRRQGGRRTGGGFFPVFLGSGWGGGFGGGFGGDGGFGGGGGFGGSGGFGGFGGGSSGGGGASGSW